MTVLIFVRDSWEQILFGACCVTWVYDSSAFYKRVVGIPSVLLLQQELFWHNVLFVCQRY